MLECTKLLLMLSLLVTGLTPVGPPEFHWTRPLQTTTCIGNHSRLLGLLTRPLSLPEMVVQLERGCLALKDVRFRAGEDTIESISPAQFAQVARALGLVDGAYRVAVPPEQAPGLRSDTLQARRRGTRLRDELVHYGASPIRLLEDPGWPISPAVVAPGAVVPMLIRVPDPRFSPDSP